MTRFEKFLINRGALEAFEKNYNLSQDYDDFIKESNRDCNIIQRAFVWLLTPEGADFWNKISDEWVDCLFNDTI